MNKILFTTNNHLGDVLICTSVLSNIKRSFPNLRLGLKSEYNEVFENSDFFDPEINIDNYDKMMKIEYAPFSQKTASGGTCCEGFNRSINDRFFSPLGRGFDIIDKFPILNLTEEEKAPAPYYQYWVINANWQTCSETKAYPWYQEIVNLRPDIVFVQIGSQESRDVQQSLDNVVDLRGKTNIRELISLISKSKGVLGPVSSTTHIAQALNIPCIAINGNREPAALTKHPKTIHFHKDGGCGYTQKKSCLTFKTSKKTNKTCKAIVEYKGFKYPACMHNVSPESVALEIN